VKPAVPARVLTGHQVPITARSFEKLLLDLLPGGTKVSPGSLMATTSLNYGTYNASTLSNADIGTAAGAAQHRRRCEVEVAARGRRAFWSDRLGVGSDEVLATGRGRPFEDSRPQLAQRPARELLDLMVEPAKAAQVAAAGAAALVVGDRVVLVAAPGGLAAGHVTAGLITGDDVLAQPGRWPVMGCLVQVGAAVLGDGVAVAGIAGCRALGGLLRGSRCHHATPS
jgi:hypothetical protein